MSVRCVRDLARVVIAVPVLWSCVATAGDLQPSAIAPASGSGVARSDSPLPFGSAAQLASGQLLEKWNVATTELRIDIDVLAACRADPEACESVAAKRLLQIVDAALRREGRGRIGEINRAVNLAISATTDRNQYGVEDKWASPLVTFTSGRGDCEDYVLAKYAALRAAGFDAGDLRLVIVYLPQLKIDHAVLAIRHESRWLVLDNRRFAMLDPEQLDGVPLFALREADPPAYMAAQTHGAPYLL